MRAGGIHDRPQEQPLHRLLLRPREDLRGASGVAYSKKQIKLVPSLLGSGLGGGAEEGVGEGGVLTVGHAWP